ncbi:hypothetical protein BU16DRAFT_197408 [Lophium mytilinum]|uniref:Uncharacterized protein n=1 Tax=Lophium mytilinum TaxID=390894 RepID=A0A6A6RD71_9PEZI|nr:hypothetical protein BU16DRAFT_197408 [Lophium mytilinum]
MAPKERQLSCDSPPLPSSPRRHRLRPDEMVFPTTDRGHFTEDGKQVANYHDTAQRLTVEGNYLDSIVPATSGPSASSQTRPPGSGTVGPFSQPQPLDSGSSNPITSAPIRRKPPKANHISPAAYALREAEKAASEAQQKHAKAKSEPSNKDAVRAAESADRKLEAAKEYKSKLLDVLLLAKQGDHCATEVIALTTSVLNELNSTKLNSTPLELLSLVLRSPDTCEGYEWVEDSWYADNIMDELVLLSLPDNQTQNGVFFCPIGEVARIVQALDQGATIDSFEDYLPARDLPENATQMIFFFNTKNHWIVARASAFERSDEVHGMIEVYNPAVFHKVGRGSGLAFAKEFLPTFMEAVSQDSQNELFRRATWREVIASPCPLQRLENTDCGPICVWVALRLLSKIDPVESAMAGSEFPPTELERVAFGKQVRLQCARELYNRTTVCGEFYNRVLGMFRSEDFSMVHNQRVLGLLKEGMASRYHYREDEIDDAIAELEDLGRWHVDGTRLVFVDDMES